MPASPRYLFAVLAVAVVAASGYASTAQAAELLYGIDGKNRLIAFGGASPRAITRVTLTGLPAGEQIVGLDVRPAKSQLYGVSSSSRLYTIDPSTGATAPVGSAPLAPALRGASFGFDFNPTVDRIRLVSDARQNLRLHPDTGAVAVADGAIAYGASDRGAGLAPRLVGSAYTNSVAGATATQLYGIDAGRDVLVLQNPPNAGTLGTVGSLGLDATDVVGFDIAGSDGTAYLAVQRAGDAVSTLHTVSLATGAATLVGRIGGRSPVRALAAAGAAPADTSAPSLAVEVFAAKRLKAIAAAGVGLRATCSEACTIQAQLRLGRRLIGSASVSTDLAGGAGLRIRLTDAGRALVRSLPSARLGLTVTARDAAGNASVLRRTVVAAG